MTMNLIQLNISFSNCSLTRAKYPNMVLFVDAAFFYSKYKFSESLPTHVQISLRRLVQPPFFDFSFNTSCTAIHVF
jgi:hypothetical protein